MERSGLTGRVRSETLEQPPSSLAVQLMPHLDVWTLLGVVEQRISIATDVEVEKHFVLLVGQTHDGAGGRLKRPLGHKRVYTHADQ
jgi:hypothetical protein